MVILMTVTITVVVVVVIIKATTVLFFKHSTTLYRVSYSYSYNINNSSNNNKRSSWQYAKQIKSEIYWTRHLSMLRFMAYLPNVVRHWCSVPFANSSTLTTHACDQSTFSDCFIRPVAYCPVAKLHDELGLHKLVKPSPRYSCDGS